METGGLAVLARSPRYRYISKHSTTRAYIAAWLVWIIGIAAYLIVRREMPGGNPLGNDDPNLAALVVILDVLILVMFVLWLAALARLARQHDWGWFAAVLILQLVGLGIIGMVAYAIAGPIDVDLTKPGIT